MIEPMHRLILAVLLTCALSQSARATVVVALDTAEMVKRSDRIVRGHVVDRRARWDDAHERIYTDVTIRVDESYKGKGGQMMVVRRLGGTVDGIGMRTIGEVEFDAGEEVFLFVRRVGPEIYQVVGLSQGKLHIARDKSGARAILNTSGAALVTPDGKAAPAPNPVRALADLEREVRALSGASK